MSDSLSKPIVVSMSAHLALVIVFFLRAVLVPDEITDLRDAIRVDVVGLPDKAPVMPQDEPPKPSPAPTPALPEKQAPPVKEVKEIAKPKSPVVDLSKNKKAKEPSPEEIRKKALAKIKAQAALEKIREDVAQSELRALKGAKVSAGNSPTGVEKIDFDRYMHGVELRVRQHWSLPQWLISGGYKAQVLVQIDEDGTIKSRKVVRGSGNNEFDQRVVETIDQSAPFPPPPERLRDFLAVKGIYFNFPQ